MTILVIPKATLVITSMMERRLLKTTSFSTTGRRGIHVYLSDHVIVHNNTVYHNLKDLNIAWCLSEGELMAAFASDVRFINNIVAPRESAVFGLRHFKPSGVGWDFNLIQGGATLQELDTPKDWGRHNIFDTAGVDFIAPTVDPRTANFHLLQGSRAIGAGNVDDAPSQDFSGAPRPRLGPIDLGALQSSVAGDQTK